TARDPRIVDENVDLAELDDGVVGCCLDRALVCQLYDLGFYRPECRQSRSSMIEPCSVDVPQRNDGPRLQRAFRRRIAYSTCTARNHGRTPGQIDSIHLKVPGLCSPFASRLHDLILPSVLAARSLTKLQNVMIVSNLT